MTAEPLKVKGHLIASSIPGLKALGEKGRAQLPAKLHRYLDEPILASVWYPIEDHLALLAVLIANIDPATLGADPYRTLGRIAARRDLKGTQHTVPDEQRMAYSGIYRGMGVSSDSLASLIKRTLLARQLYYSAGRYVAKRAGERTVRIVQEEFPLVAAAVCSTTLGYLIEVFHEAVKGTRVEHVSCRARGQAECVWELRLGPAADVSELAAFE